MAFLSPDPVTIYLSSAEMSQLKTDDDSFDCEKKKLISEKMWYMISEYYCSKNTWNMLAPYGVLQALRRLSFPVDTNHLPQEANLRLKTQLSWRCNWYLSGLAACRTSTFEFSIPTANHSPKKFIYLIYTFTIMIINHKIYYQWDNIQVKIFGY